MKVAVPLVQLQEAMMGLSHALLPQLQQRAVIMV
jgi:hypothetical protein